MFFFNLQFIQKFSTTTLTSTNTQPFPLSITYLTTEDKKKKINHREHKETERDKIF